MKFDEHLCMINSYQVLTGKISLEDLLEEGKIIHLMFNPSLPVIPMEDGVYDYVIQYFEVLEDYDKCAELHWAKCKAKNS